MTPKQRKEHLDNICMALIQAKWEQDRYGHFKKEVLGANPVNYRMKMQKTSLRYEEKTGGTWRLIASDYFKNIEVSERQRFLIIKGRKIRL